MPVDTKTKQLQDATNQLQEDNKMESNGGSKTELIEALSQAARGKNRFKKARLEEVIDEIETAKAAGLSHKEIVAVLALRGLIMSEGVFATTRNRILKKRGDGKHNSGQETNAPSPAKDSAVKDGKKARDASARPAKPGGPHKPISGDEIKESLRGAVNLKQYE